MASEPPLGSSLTWVASIALQESGPHVAATGEQGEGAIVVVTVVVVGADVDAGGGVVVVVAVVVAAAVVDASVFDVVARAVVAAAVVMAEVAVV